MGTRRADQRRHGSGAAIITAFSAGDVATAASHYTDDAIFHINGRGPAAVDHRGFGASVELFASTASTVDSYEQQLLDVIAGDEHSVGLLKTVMTRGDEVLESDVVSVLTWGAGKQSPRTAPPGPGSRFVTDSAMWQVLSHEATERSATVTAVGLRERKRERTRDDIVDAALHLFVDHGFEATTVESIAAAADVSQRTFFRYFPVKEDVLFDEAGSARQRDRIVVELEAHEGGVAAVRMVVDALRTLQPTWESELPTLMMRHQVISDTPALASRARRRRHLWESAVVDTLARRFGSSADALLELQVTVAATTAGTQVALDTWVSSGGRRKLGALLDQVWQLLIDGLDRPR